MLPYSLVTLRRGQCMHPHEAFGSKYYMKMHDSLTVVSFHIHWSENRTCKTIHDNINDHEVHNVSCSTWGWICRIVVVSRGVETVTLLSLGYVRPTSTVNLWCDCGWSMNKNCWRCRTNQRLGAISSELKVVDYLNDAHMRMMRVICISLHGKAANGLEKSSVVRSILWAESQVPSHPLASLECWTYWDFQHHRCKQLRHMSICLKHYNQNIELHKELAIIRMHQLYQN